MLSNEETEFRQLIFDLLALTLKLDSVRNEYGKLVGLTGIQFTMLISIAHLSEHSPVNINAIANHLHLSGAFVTNETGKLVKLGYITKQKDQSDGRRVLLNITEQGFALLAELAPRQREVNDLLFQELNQKDFRKMANFAKRLVDSGDNAVALVNYICETS